MTWWNSVDTLSKLLNWVGAFAALLACTTAALKIRYDIVKRSSDRQKSAERQQLDTELRKKADEAERKLAVANERVTVLEATQKPRRILKSDWPKLKDTSKLPTGIKVKVFGVASDPEAAQLARDAAEFFQSLGCETRIELPLMGGDSEAPEGVVIFSSKGLAIDLKPLCDALSSMGIRCQTKQGSFDSPPSFIFTVAAKPITK